MCVGDSLARPESSHARCNGVITTQRSVNDETSKLPWCSRSRPHAPALSFAGLRARGCGCLTVYEPTSTHHNIDERRGKVLNPCTQTNMCGLCVLSGLCFGGASRGSVPRPHKVFDCAQTHLLKPCM